MNAGHPLPRGDELLPAGVTRREAEVFWLVGDRLHNREVAERLVVSVRTVESHVSALLRKLGVSNRSGLVAMAAALRRQRPERALPGPLDSFVGRERELRELRHHVTTQQLVTLVGPPGAGKSRLAVEVARSVDEGDRTVFVDLAPFRPGEELPTAFLAVLGGVEAGRDVRAALIEVLAAVQGLVVVDNCEHLAEEVADLMHRTLGKVPGSHVVATSQRPLGVSGELVYPVEPLESPPVSAADPAEIMRFPAARLLLDRANSAAPRVDLTAAPVAVGALCRRLDGLPLALELAAARMRTFTADELLVRLAEHLADLGEGHGQGGDRHRTLEAALAWSVDLLTDSDRKLLERLSVFPASFGYDDIAPVAAGSDLSPSEVARSLPRLVDRSLVGVSLVAAVDSRYRLLESIRTFAAVRLHDADPQGTTQRSHAMHHLRKAGAAGSHLLGIGQHEWLGWLERRWSDVRQGMRWALRHDDAIAWRFVGDVGFGWEVVGIRAEVHTWLDELLDAGLPDDEESRAKAALAATLLLDYRDSARALELAETCVTSADAVGAPVLRAHARIARGWALASQGLAHAGDDLRAALELLHGTGEQWATAYALQGLGRATTAADPAIEHFEAAAARFAAIGDAVKESNVRYMMAATCIDRGERLDDARRWLDDAERLATESGSPHERLHAALQRTRIDRLEGRATTAQESLAGLLTAFRRIGDRRCVSRCLLGLGELEVERGALDTAVSLLVEALAVASEVKAPEVADAAGRGLARARSATGSAARGRDRAGRRGADHDRGAARDDGGER